MHQDANLNATGNHSIPVTVGRTSWRDFTQTAGEEKFGGEGLLLTSRDMATCRFYCSIYFHSDQFSCKWNMILSQLQKNIVTGSGGWTVSFLCAITHLRKFDYQSIQGINSYKLLYKIKQGKKYSWYNSTICNTRNPFALKLYQV